MGTDLGIHPILIGDILLMDGTDPRITIIIPIMDMDMGIMVQAIIMVMEAEVSTGIIMRLKDRTGEVIIPIGFLTDQALQDIEL